MAQTAERTTLGEQTGEALSGREADVLRQLDELVRQTHLLWDQEWVGFSWRNYTYDHVRRVRNLAVSLAAEVGADTRVLDFASVFQTSDLQHEKLRLGDFTDHPGKFFLDELMRSNGLIAELFTKLRILQRTVVARHGRADRAP